MTKAKTKALIDAAYRALDRACDESGDEAQRLITKAYYAALEGERRHRRFGAGLGGYRMSADTAARWFVVKWFVDPGKVTNARQACQLRLDCLYASALRVVLADTLGGLEPLALLAALEPAAALDYSTDIARAA